jgi:hypothetical protein
MVFLTLALIGLRERRWLLVALAIPLVALTRPLGAPLALALAILTLVRWKSDDRRPLVGLTLLAGAATAVWPLAAWWVTRRPSAYVDTEFAWRRPYYGENESHSWGTGWWDSANWWFPDVAVPVILALAAVVVVVAMLPATKRLGAVLIAWLVGYLGYLILVLFPQSSIFRLLAPMWPIAGAISRSRTASLVAIGAGIVGQYFWVYWCWSVQGSDWTPP